MTFDRPMGGCAAVALALCLAPLGACEEEEPVEEAVEETGEALEEAGEEVEDAADEAGDALDDTVGDGG